MPLADDIAAVRARGDLSEDEKRQSIYTLKVDGLLDVILNGKPAPQPIPSLIGRSITLDGTTFTLDEAWKGGTPEVPALVVRITLTRGPRTVSHTVSYTNPPLVPRTSTGNEKRDLIQAVSELLAQLPME